MYSKNQKQTYQCLPCNYITFRKNDYDKHITTNKHRKLVNTDLTIEKDDNEHHICQKCNKGYKHYKSLVRHEKTCQGNVKTTTTNTDTKIAQIEEINSTLLKSLEEADKNNKLLFNKITELQSTPQIVNNMMTVNNEYNINLFFDLNYKGALNLDYFLKNQLKIDHDDLLYTKNNGFAKGIANIFIKNLEELGEEKRPIHYSENKNQSFFIKNDNSWVQDKEHEEINSVINNVALQQITKIKEWERENPNWEASAEKTTEYIEIVKKISFDSKTKNEADRDLDFIKETLKNNVEIDVNTINN